MEQVLELCNTDGDSSETHMAHLRIVHFLKKEREGLVSHCPANWCDGVSLESMQVAFQENSMLHTV